MCASNDDFAVFNSRSRGEVKLTSVTRACDECEVRICQDNPPCECGYILICGYECVDHVVRLTLLPDVRSSVHLALSWDMSP